MTSSRAIPRSIGIAIVIIALSGSAYWLITKTTIDSTKGVVDVADQAAGVGIDRGRELKELMKETAHDIKNGLNLSGRITVGQTIVSEATRVTSELAITEKTFTHTYSWKHVWAGSTKELHLKGTFRGKAGYDLTGKWSDPQNPWGIHLSEDGKVIEARIPPPSILSVEMTNYEIITDDSGLWNKVSEADREGAVNALQQGARSELQETGILEDVEETFMTQLEEIARKSAPIDFELIRSKLP